MDALDILKKLSLDEKLLLLTGKDFWSLPAIPAFNLESITITDGPHGLRKQMVEGELDLSKSIPSTCFPTASALASSWDIQLLKEVGEALGEVCLNEDVSVILGPGMNIKRHPLGGRNFEYFSEDPVLSGNLAASMIEGIQSKNVGACVKHFAVNNQETMRMTVNAVVDERTLREVYLKSFEIAVKKAKPWTLMSAYNRINGDYAGENKKLLTDILRDEWGFDGLVMTDWGANNDPVKALKSGLNLEMPSNQSSLIYRLKKALKSGDITKDVIDQRVLKNIELIVKSNKTLKENYPLFDAFKHHLLAKKAASNSMVLLKNEHNILPLDINKQVLLVGQFAKYPRYQGSGSSLIQPIQLTNAYDAFKEVLRDQLTYAKGYHLNTEEIDYTLIEEAMLLAENVDVVFLMVGLPDDYEIESCDREHIDLPGNHQILIEKLSRLNKPLIVSLSNGAPVRIPCIQEIDCIIEQYLSGEASGEALADIVFGRVSPSGKLAETFPNHLDELPAHKNFPGKDKQVEYREGPMIGYKAYDIQNIKPMFCFGYGLTYTTFAYKDFNVYNDIEGKRIIIKGTIKNTGSYKAKEIVQVYVSKPKSIVFRPEKSLQTFKKVEINPQEEVIVQMEIPYDDLKIYQKAYLLETGEYVIKIGSSSQDIHFEFFVSIMSNDQLIEESHKNYKELLMNNEAISSDVFETILGYSIPQIIQSKKYHMNSTLGEIKHLKVGKYLYGMIEKQMMGSSLENDKNIVKMMRKLIDEMPIRTLVNFSQGKLSYKRAQGLIDVLNKHFIKGMFKIIVG